MAELIDRYNINMVPHAIRPIFSFNHSYYAESVIVDWAHV
jgi:hypothetical protein